MRRWQSRIVAGLLVALLGWLLPQVALRKKIEPTSAAAFESQVMKLDVGLGGELIVLKSISGGPEFQKLADKAPANLKACLSVLGSGRLSDQGKRIAIYSMHRLEIEDYFVFCSGVFELTRAGELTSDMLDQAISPGLSFSNVLVENYDRPEVASLLDRIAADPTTPDYIKKKIPRIKSGQSLRDLRWVRFEIMTDRWFGVSRF